MIKGFTLVELLAVIVILAVLALIATPVVLSIIDDAKESAMLRSAEMYLNGVENAVMRENMNSGGNFRPNECDITNGNMICGSTTVEVEVDGEVPSTGSITFENGKITEVTLNYESGTIIKDSSGSLVYEGSESSKTIDDICTYDSTNGVAEKTAGAKYSCEVKDGTSYNFYVLTTPASGDTKINLIMDRNICEDGTPTDASKEDKCLVMWYTSENNTDGPVTAMTYLNNATSTWKNVDNLNFKYDDASGIFTEFVLNGKARLPYKSEVTSFNNSNWYLYEYLESEYWSYDESLKPTNNISGINGYWTLSASDARSDFSWAVGSSGNVFSNYVCDSAIGVRPVITLKL